MALADNIEQFSKLPVQHKILAFIFVAAFFGVIFYFMFYSDLSNKEKALVQQIGTLETEKSDYQKKKDQYLTFRKEVTKLMEKQKDLIKVLPSKSEIHSLLQAIHAQAELAGLNILTFEQQPEVREQYYAKIPVKLAIAGTFHQITRFFYAVGKLKRIVNIQNLALKNPQLEDRGVIIQAGFLASTFRFLAPEGGEGQAGKGKPQE